MRVKICGITKPEQGRAIAQLGATALGFICVRDSPRYVSPDHIRGIVEQLPVEGFDDERRIDLVGVFADASIEEIEQVVAIAQLTTVQLHGKESPEFCHQLKTALPQVEVMKALRVRSVETLEQVTPYQKWVDTLLLDAYHPGLLGGTGKTLDWSSLQRFRPACPWFLAGGLTPDNVPEALRWVQPDGIDLSSGVERSPGDKDLERVAHLFEQLQVCC